MMAAQFALHGEDATDEHAAPDTGVRHRVPPKKRGRGQKGATTRATRRTATQKPTHELAPTKVVDESLDQSLPPVEFMKERARRIARIAATVQLLVLGKWDAAGPRIVFAWLAGVLPSLLGAREGTEGHRSLRDDGHDGVMHACELLAAHADLTCARDAAERTRILDRIAEIRRAAQPVEREMIAIADALASPVDDSEDHAPFADIGERLSALLCDDTEAVQRACVRYVGRDLAIAVGVRVARQGWGGRAS